MTGYPEGPPVHAGFSQGDATTALMAAFAAMSSLHQRDTDPDFSGEHIDLALFETLFRLADFQVIFRDQLGRAPERSGNRLANAPAAVVNTYLSADEHWVTITSATLKSVLNVVRMMGLDESKYQTWDDQRAGADEIDAALAEWVAQRSVEEVLAEMRAHHVTGDRIFSVDDIVADPIYAEREDIITLEDPDLGPIRMQGVVPKMLRNPGRVWRPAPALGQDNLDVLGRWLEMTSEECAALAERGVI